ncbi:acyltransferase [Cellulomonas sp. C5510]|uniref:acyltransferase family protein n=1 Tax=Cellulomonas sp. C5510 TaxID=2871170 RepID=UPI001C9800F7|nr:acyltransferase [Cellulomonas sp. C5510]QZN84622.1 acyltransferase [Cellulomonas sp. C5510]
MSTIGARAPNANTTVSHHLPRLGVLDLLRLVAAVSVVLFHLTARDHSRWAAGLPHTVFPGLAAVSRYGYLGVHLFFAISGFVILLSAWGRPARALVASRVSRLFPAYWAAVLLTATLRWAWPGFDARTPGEVLVNLTMLQDPLGVPRVDGVYWTLWVELQFYVVVAVMARIGLTAPRVVALCAVAPAVTLVALQVPSVARFASLTEWLPLFCAGMAVFVIRREGGRAVLWLVLVANTLTAAAVAATRTTSAIDAIASGPRTSPAVVAAGVVLVVGLVAAAALVPQVSRVDARWLTAAGLLTYPLYLTHEYVGWAVIDLLSPLTAAAVVLAAACAVCGGVAVALHRAAERPVQRRVRRWLEHGLRVGDGPPARHAA